VQISDISWGLTVADGDGNVVGALGRKWVGCG